MENVIMQSPRFMVVSDLDNTMVDHQDAENISLLRFNALWEAAYRQNSLLVFSTGRSPTLYKKLRNEKPMLTPDITIMSVGTEITYGDSMIPDKGWEEVLDQEWDRDIVVEEASKFSQLKFQVESEQRPHKVSFYIEKANAQKVIDSLSNRLKERQLNVKLIYSGGIDLDILPQGAGKGQALAYLLKKFAAEGTSPQNTLVCGDSGNDAELFSVDDVYGVMVGNAQEELLHWYEENARGNPNVFLAKERCAAGILQAMQHFSLIPNISPRDVELTYAQPKSFPVGYEIVEFNLLFERWMRGEVENPDAGFEQFTSVIDPNCRWLCLWGEGKKFSELSDDLKDSYGEKKRSNFRTWIDKIHPEKIALDVWLVVFHRWELTDRERCCYVTTAVLKEKAQTRNSLSWLHIHETLLDGCGNKSVSSAR